MGEFLHMLFTATSSCVETVSAKSFQTGVKNKVQEFRCGV